MIEFNKEWIRERKRCALDNRDYGREQRAMKQMKNNDDDVAEVRQFVS